MYNNIDKGLLVMIICVVFVYVPTRFTVEKWFDLQHSWRFLLLNQFKLWEVQSKNVQYFKKKIRKKMNLFLTKSIFVYLL